MISGDRPVAAAAAGANAFVAGNAVFKDGPERYAARIDAIRDAAQGGERANAEDAA